MKKVVLFALCLLSWEANCQNICSKIDSILVPFRKGDQWGYMNSKGKYIINPGYDSVGFFGHNKEKKRLAFVKKDNETFLINESGQRVADSVADNGNIHLRYRLMLDILNELQRDIEERLYFPSKDGRYAFRTQTDTVLGFDYTNFGSYDKKKRLLTLKKDKWILFDDTGNELSQYDSISSFYNDQVAVIREKNKFGLIDGHGKIVVKPKYQTIEKFNISDPFIIVRRKNKYGLIDKKGRVIAPTIYERIVSFNDDYNLYRLTFADGRYGYIDCNARKYFEQ